MKKIELARAWRDQDYYLSLTEEERASLGAHPAGAAPLDDEVLKSIAGGCSCTDFCPRNFTCGAIAACSASPCA